MRVPILYLEGLDSAFAARFWSHVRKADGDGCWEWTASVNPLHGYGQCSVRQRTRRAHRVAWMLTYGPIVAGQNVCHHCDNRVCVRPDHLWLGTQADNVADMDAKGRANRPVLRMEQHPLAKLDVSKVLAAARRSIAGEPVAFIAREFGVSAVSLMKALNGETWAEAIPNDVRTQWRSEHQPRPLAPICRNGHAYTPETRRGSNGARYCAVCRHAKDVRHYQRRSLARQVAKLG